MEENNKENDPLKAQKRLFGTLKKIVDKSEKYFENDDELQNAYQKNSDPAYKYINKQDWKSQLNDEEKEYLKKYPSPIFEGELTFKNRFAAHKKFKQKQNEQINFSSEDLEKNEPIMSSKNKKAKKSLKKENMSELICSQCGFPLNDKEDVFCPECGAKVIYPANEVETKTIEISNSTKENEYIEVPETKNVNKEESLISNEEKKDITTSHNNLPIDILIDLKSFFEDKLINENEYNHLRKLALSIAKESQSKEGLEKIKSISREKLTELRNLFNEELIDKDEYDDLRKNLIEIE